MDDSIPSKRRKVEWSLQTWPFLKKAGSLYPSRPGAEEMMYDWSGYEDPGDLVARPRDNPEPGTSKSPTLGRNQRLLRRESDLSTVWLRWDGEPAGSPSSAAPFLSQNNHGPQADCPIKDIRREDESQRSRSTSTYRMNILTHGNPDYDFTPSGGLHPVLWVGAVVRLDGTVFSVTAHQVSQELEDPNPNLSKVMEQTSKMSLKHCWDYIVDMSRCSKKKVTIHRILPRGRKDEANFARLFSRLYSRACAAIMEPTCRSITDIYVIPLGSGDIMPACVPLMEGLETGVNALLAVFVRNRRGKRLRNESRPSSALGVMEDGRDHSVEGNEEGKNSDLLFVNDNSNEREAREFLESILIRPPVRDGNDSADVGPPDKSILEDQEEASVENEVSEGDGNLIKSEREDDNSSTIELEEVIKREVLSLCDQELSLIHI